MSGASPLWGGVRGCVVEGREPARAAVVLASEPGGAGHAAGRGRCLVVAPWANSPLVPPWAGASSPLVPPWAGAAPWGCLGAPAPFSTCPRADPGCAALQAPLSFSCIFSVAHARSAQGLVLSGVPQGGLLPWLCLLGGCVCHSLSRCCLRAQPVVVS